MTDAGQAATEQAATDLRAQSDSFVANLERLMALEQIKRNVLPTDPRFAGIAREVEGIARALLNDARGQTVLADTAHEAGVESPIAEISPDLSRGQIVSGWRDAERQLESVDPGSDEARAISATINAYRSAYLGVFDGRTKDDT